MTDSRSTSTSQPADLPKHDNTSAKGESEENALTDDAKQNLEESKPSLGSEEPNAQNDDDDDAENRENEGTKSGNGESTSKNAEEGPSESPAPSANPWQAIWSPQYNAYYFFNSVTQETTWTNPLQPSAATSASDASLEPQASTSAAGAASAAAAAATSTSSSFTSALEAAALAQGIDPSLAYLDPSLVQTATVSGTPIPGALPPTFTAKFNARTGQFARPDARDPTHLSEYERAKRMSEFYFDVNAWEQDVAHRKEEEEEGADGKKRKRLSKKDLVRSPDIVPPCYKRS